MSKSLRTVQKVCKVCKVLAEIAFVMLVVGAVLTLAGGILIGKGDLDAMLASGMASFDEALLTSPDARELIMAGCIVLGIMMTAEAVVAKFINVYFKRELKAGTPFTFEGAKEMFRLGIITIAVPLGASIVTAIYVATTTIAEGSWNFSIEVSLGMGLAFIAISPLLKHGTELRLRAQYAEEKLAETEVKPADSEEDSL